MHTVWDGTKPGLWTLDSGLDFGLDYGLDYGPDYGLGFGLDSKLNSCFQAFPLSST